MDPAPSPASTEAAATEAPLLSGDTLQQVIAEFDLALALRIGLVMLAAVVLGYLGSVVVGRALERSGNTTFASLGRRLVMGLALGLGLASVLEQLGVDLSVLLGAAGVFTVAIGFASQTSASNLISGIFLMLERTVNVGDVLRVGTTTGEVVSVDLLSVKLRTFDNLLVRVPNEQLVKSEITNLSRFPIRRIDLVLMVAPSEDLDMVMAVLRQAAEDEARVLQEPRPQILINGFAELGVELQFSCWTRREGFVEVRTSLFKAIRRSLLDAGFNFAIPRRELVPAGGASSTPGHDEP